MERSEVLRRVRNLPAEGSAKAAELIIRLTGEIEKQGESGRLWAEIYDSVPSSDPIGELAFFTGIQKLHELLRIQGMEFYDPRNRVDPEFIYRLTVCWDDGYMLYPPHEREVINLDKAHATLLPDLTSA